MPNNFISQLVLEECGLLTEQKVSLSSYTDKDTNSLKSQGHTHYYHLVRAEPDEMVAVLLKAFHTGAI